ncbi:hypothetical protein AB0J80_23690 [Actinoplanes sp. NPDC049548]|uniref:hypothetical protein n=1 Tax=Actinoplanes sp. NPDC049548 TaxID=3155152 RepID=UPI00342B808D
MARLGVAVNPAVGVEPAALAKAWAGDEEAAAVGTAALQSSASGSFFVQDHPAVDMTEFELAETVSGDDRVAVVRVRRSTR